MKFTLLTFNGMLIKHPILTQMFTNYKRFFFDPNKPYLNNKNKYYENKIYVNIFCDLT